jgi:S-adenosylmethionine:tRNA ribosyltransferase-isomerase
MNTSEFDYYLFEGLIATKPANPRSTAKLLVMDREKGTLTDSTFLNLEQFLKKGDVLVFNDSRVIPARLKASYGGKEFEILLVKGKENGIWECLIRPGKKALTGDTFHFDRKLSAQIVERKKEIFVLKFNLSDDDFLTGIEKIGTMPLPPYIQKERVKKGLKIGDKFDEKEYQTFCANKPGSVAAPTAGLHFDEVNLERLNKNGMQFEKITLHVSLGTFQPVKTEKIENFKIHSEYFEISKKTADRLNEIKKKGGRIIAVGTTSVRVLETVADENRRLKSGAGETDLFIYPGYKFKFVDGMITNFHLPKSSLLMLVSAFAGKDKVLSAYQHAIDNKYRFYSYGDGMLIL